jgi:hypothetical protein
MSLKVIAPTGQYDPTKLINLGSNRWSIKPELGVSQRWGHWMLDGYASVWIFTKNPDFFSRNEFSPGSSSQTQDPIAALETHLSYDVQPGLWVSLDANFWRGGRTSLDGVENPETLQQSSRVGVTASFPAVASPVVEAELRPGRLHPLRWRLPDLLGRVAVLVGRRRAVEAKEHSDVALRSRRAARRTYVQRTEKRNANGEEEGGRNRNRRLHRAEAAERDA